LGQNDRLTGTGVDFGKSIALNPTNALAWRDRGFAYRSKGDSARAIADATEAIRLDPDVARAHLDLGLTSKRPAM